MAKLPIADPGPQYDAKHEAMLRKMIEHHAAYAESGKTFDPEGKYLCGDCDMRRSKASCTVVEDGSSGISFSNGGCRRWEGGEPMGKPLPKKSSQLTVGYSERPKGFGCKRCEYGAKAIVADKDGRDVWCGFWGVHVIANACCEEEDGPDLIFAPGHTEKEEGEAPKKVHLFGARKSA